MTEHTPTPWEYRPHQYDDWGYIRGRRPEIGSCVGSLAAIARGADGKSYDEHRAAGTDPYAANALLIVEAVNNHEALKAENERLRSELEQAKGQVESLRNALEPFIALRDQSPTQMAKVIHKGIAGTIPIALTVTKDQFKAACSAFGLSPSPSSTKLQGDQT